MKPKVFIYNPTCEMAIANGTVSFMPNKLLTQFEKDLDVLPMYFANEQDIVLVHQQPDFNFISSLQKLGVKIPKFEVLQPALNDTAFVSKPKQSLEPWGWSPRVHHILRKLKANCSSDFQQQPNANWKIEHRDLYSRKKALEVLNSFINNHDSKYISGDFAAKACKSVSEIEKLLNQWKQIVIKAPWSSSGRGLQVLRQSCLNNSIVQWINGTLDLQQYVMVEPLLDKLYDFSLQYHIAENQEIRFLGNGFFETNTNGQYDSNILGGMPNELGNYLTPDLLHELSNGIKNAIIESDLPRHYCGYLGVDCMVYEDKHFGIKIHPCVEINLRYNMGTLAIFLNRFVHPDSKGVFKVYFDPKSSFDKFHSNISVKKPLQIKENKWYSGYLPLVSPYQNKTFGAYVILEPNI